MRGRSQASRKSTLLHHRGRAVATGPPFFAPGLRQIEESYEANETRQNHTWLSRAFLLRLMPFFGYFCRPFSGPIDVLHAARLSARLRVSARVCSIKAFDTRDHRSTQS